MALFGRMINSLREGIGLDTTADAMDRKIERIGSTKGLESQKILNEMQIEQYNHEKYLPEQLLNRINEMLKDIERIKELAREDTKKVDSGMLENIKGYRGNIAQLETYLEIYKKHMGLQLVLQLEKEVEEARQRIIKRYINRALSHAPQDDGRAIENYEINSLYETTKRNAQLVEITSQLTGYAWLDEIYRKCWQKKTQLNADIFQVDQLKRPYEMENEAIKYQINSIESQKQMLRNTKEYIRKNADREARKR